MSAAGLARRQQQQEELCAAAIRALSGFADLHFRGRRLHQGRRRLPRYAPHLHPQIESDDFASHRGAADGLALRLRLSDPGLHRQLAPADAVQRMLFDLFEQFRVEALGDAAWPGVQQNLRHRFEQWSLAFHQSGLTDSARGLLLFTVAQISRARVTAQAPLQALEDLMEATRAGTAALLGDALSQLRRTRHEQAAYARPALALAQTVARLLTDAASAAGAEDEEDEGASEEDRNRVIFGFMLDSPDALESEGAQKVRTGHSRVLADSEKGYRIYSSAFDREMRPASQIRPEQLDAYRQQLDSLVAAQGLNLNRLARQLGALLSTPRDDDFVGAQDEGLIDGRSLSQLISSPTERRLFRQPQRHPQADTSVSFLIDCSGSMRQPVQTLSLLLDLLARALDMAGVPNEMLGFSTQSWNGGRVMKQWRRAGSPPHPGRLNETLHLVFKDADTAWRHARRDIAALLRPELFREGVDGEALQWAAGRLRQRSEARKLLVVLSDGCPMDAATELANDAQYLDHHLQQVAADIECQGDIQLSAIGVGLDLSPYYGRCLALDLESASGRTGAAPLLQEIVTLLGQAVHHRRPR